jgi:hypothetical protein
VLLVRVEEAIEGGGRHTERLGDERGEEHAELAQAGNVLLEDGAEVRQVCGRGPLVRRQQVVVQRLFRAGDGVGRREVELLSVIGVAGCCFVVQL